MKKMQRRSKTDKEGKPLDKEPKKEKDGKNCNFLILKRGFPKFRKSQYI